MREKAEKAREDRKRRSAANPRGVGRMTKLERSFFELWKRLGNGPEPETEHRFHPTRKWRFDFAWPDQKVAVEMEGGVFKRGGHTRGKHYTSDCTKYNAAAELGWRVLRYTVKHVEESPVQMIEQVQSVLGS